MIRPRWHEITAIFGGRFDPPHLGHREAVRGLFKNPGVQSVLIIPSAAPPHKPTFASVEKRAEMARINFSSTPYDSYPQEVRFDDRELRRARLRPGVPSYSFDTIRELQQEYPSLAFTLGTDQLIQLPTWHRFPEILGLCHWLVLDRPGDHSTHSKAQKTLQEWASSGLVHPTSSPSLWIIGRAAQTTQTPLYLTLCPTNAAAISSTAIRESISRTGFAPERTMLPEVLTYLKNRPSYGYQTC